MSLLRKKTALLIITVFGLFHSLSAKTIYVNGATTSGNNDGTSWATAYDSIEQGLGNAIADDEVWVAKGTYTATGSNFISVPQNVSVFGGFNGNEEQLDDRDFAANLTVIDGDEQFSLLDNAGVFDGFTLTKGIEDSETPAAVINTGTLSNCHLSNNVSQPIVYNESGIVINCIVTENTGTGISNSEGTVTDCIISKNSSSEGPGGVSNSGGGIVNCQILDNETSFYIYHHPPYGIPIRIRAAGGINHSSGTISNCIISGNSATGEGGGGGVKATNGTVSHCIISNNTSLNAPAGGITMYTGDVIGCKIYGNTSPTGYSGMLIYKGTAYNCLVYANENQGERGAVGNENGIIRFCTIYKNKMPSDSPPYYHCGLYTVNGDVYNSIIWDNGGIDVCGHLDDFSYCCFGGADGSNYNINAIPLFENVEGDSLENWDLRLQNGSPCVDMGTRHRELFPDHDGNDRPGSDGYVCIGAYESPPDYTPTPTLPNHLVFVAKNGNNNGGSDWENAYTSIKKALYYCHYSNISHKIHIAGGRYQEGEILVVPERIELVGSYPGVTFPEEPSLDQTPTIIDCNNTHQGILTFSNISSVVIENGRADWWGGGMHSRGATIKNCRFVNNLADKGGGLYSEDSMIQDCIFDSNTAIANGGGALLIQSDVVNCQFSNNEASYGGGVYANETAADGIDSSITGCEFMNNNSSHDGGGLYWYDGMVSHCTFSNNHSGQWGGGALLWNASASNLTLTENSGNYGGGLALLNCPLSDSTFSENTSISFGGGLYIKDSSVLNCIFDSNSCDQLGGGIYMENSHLKKSTIKNNFAISKGGGVFMSEPSTISSCHLLSNHCSKLGGGIYIRTDGTVINSVLTDNEAGDFGGGIILNAHGQVLSSTLFSNSSVNPGGGIHNKLGEIVNTIVWGNINGDITNNLEGVSHCCFSEAGSISGNIAQDPLFLFTDGDDPTNWDLRLSTLSPCLNAGSDQLAPIVDITGSTRYPPIDLGAYESAPKGLIILSH